MVSVLTVNAGKGAFLSLGSHCQVSRILSCQVKLTTSRQEEEGGPLLPDCKSLPLSHTHTHLHKHTQLYSHQL